MRNADNAENPSKNISEEKPVSQLLHEQSEELKDYIDRKHREMEELIAESEGRLSEQLREKKHND